MPQETKSAAAPTELATLQGLEVSREDEQGLLSALEKAFDYRGDVTIVTRGGDAVTGYIFDRRCGDGLEHSSVRLLTPQDDAPRTIRYSDIRSLAFTGKDAAHGKSFETWVKKYIEKKLAGEAANIENEPIP